MRTLVALALVPGLAGLALAAPDRPKKLYTIEQFMKTTSLGGPSFSADERSIIYTSDESGVYNVYSVPVGGGKAKALTRSKETTFAAATFPKDDRVLVMRDQGGNELDHVYVLEGGKEKDLTPGDKLKADFVGFSHDFASFYLMTNERNPKFFDLYKYDAKSYARTLVYQDDTGYRVADVSGDGRWIAFVKPNTTADSDIFLYDLDKKAMQKISAHEGTATYEPVTFDPASKALYYKTNDGGEFTRVARYDLASGKREDVQKADWDIVGVAFSHDGKYRATIINEDAHTKVELVENATGQPVALPPLPAGAGEIRGARFALSETKLALIIAADRRPADIYAIDLPAQKLTRLTDTLNKEIDPDDLVDSEVVRFKSFDGMTIPNILYKPHRASPEHKAPALVWVHGGPGGQTRRGYSAALQYLANHGYVLLGINNRGSSGYGKTFFTADDRKHGHEPLDDCVAGKKFLASLPYVDPQRIGIIGGSYGGYMVLAALAFRPDEFAVGVDLFGVANWVRVLKSIPPYWEAMRQALYAEMGDPDKDADQLNAVSPLVHPEGIKKPLLVLQGKNDPRVLEQESAEMVAAVKKNGVPVEYVLFPDEGHGFAKKKNEIAGWKTILAFLDKHLKK